MRCAQRKWIARILLVMMSIYLLPATAVEDSRSLPMDNCQAMLSVAGYSAEPANLEPDQICGQHRACVSYCQITPLHQDSLLKVQTGQLLSLVLTDEPHNLITRFLEGIDRPPRV